MKITYIRLKNFNTIKSGMRRKNLEIDLTKCKNNIVLLVGPNGSGKTSILSTLHPFAYAGNMDVRTNSSLIIQGQDGEKEIHISHNGNMYKIVHYYKNSNKGITVKSYISKNDEELNPNGNVTSFNEIVYSELGVQQEYLKLLRLGSSVTNFIKMKATERKNFISDLFSELDIWASLYKKINDDNRMLKGVINTATSKLQRLNISSESEIKKEIKSIEKEMDDTNKTMDSIKNRIGSIEGSINTIIPTGVDSIKLGLDELLSEKKYVSSEIKTIQSQLNGLDVIITGDHSEYLFKIKEDISDSKAKLESKTYLKQSLSDIINDRMNVLDTLNIELSHMVTNDNYNDMILLKDKLTDSVKKYESKHKNYIPPTTRDNVMVLINTLYKVDAIISKIYEFDTDCVMNCCRLMLMNENIQSTVASAVTDIDTEMATIKAQSKTSKSNDECLVLFRPIDCKSNTCPYLDLYNRYFNKPQDKNSTTIDSLEVKREKYLQLADIERNIQSIMMTLTGVSHIIQALDINYLNEKSIVTRIMTNNSVWSESLLVDISNDIEDYNIYQSELTELKNIETSLIAITANSTQIDSIKSQITEIDREILKYQIDIEKLSKEIDEYSSHIDKMSIHLKDVSAYIALSNSYDEQLTTFQKLEVEICSYKRILESVHSYLSELDTEKERLNTYADKLTTLNKNLFNKKYIYKEYETLNKELSILNERYEIISITKESLSSNKGIPLLFIQLYLQSTTIFVNQILQLVCDDFEIAGFDISESEFNVPYIKNGIQINDVIHASEGERSFLSLALSCALIKKSIQDYTILLLDEIDAALDIRNRAVFLNILTHQIELIGSEQVFMITHNNMFDSYPVDIIMTGEASLDNYTNANIIFKGE